MRKVTFYSISVLLICILGTISCRHQGEWNKMVWKVDNGQKANNQTYSLSAEGDIITFTCTNYSSPWICDALSESEHYYPDIENNDIFNLSADWFKAQIIGNVLRVSFEPNTTEQERTLELTVSAGDIFYTFKFKQKAE